MRADQLYAAWLLLATTGMRRGEVAGLRWVDVDLDAGRASPRRPWVVVDYEIVVVSAAKTAKGRRSLAVGPRWQDSGLVLTWPDGRPLHPSASPGGSSSTPARPACRRSGCTTSATAMRPRRWPPASRVKVVSERLGHANIVITMDTYSHVLPGLDAQAAGTLRG